MHTESHPGAGQTVTVELKAPIATGIDAGLTEFEFVIEDWWDKLTGESLWRTYGNFAVSAYAYRAGTALMPKDDEVLYGHNKASGMGHLVHVDEIVSVVG